VGEGPVGVLAEIMVVDTSVGLAGPAATRWLAELGATVLKVEPVTGDPARWEQPAGFATWNRSKQAVSLDVDSTEDQARLDELLARADVFVHDWTPRQAAGRACGVGDLAARHPDLIVASVTAYPIEHPDAERPGDELLVQARLGAMDEQEALRDGPMFIRMPFASWGAAYLLAGGIAARLLERERTGIARSIHTSLLQGALAPAALYWQRAGDPPDWLAQHTLPKLDEPPHITIFRCADGRWLQVMGGFTKAEPLRTVLAEVGAEDLFGGWATWDNRDRWAEVFARRTVDEWTALLWPVDAVCMPVLEMGEVFALEQARANGYAVEVDDPKYGRTLQAGPAFDVSPVTLIGAPAPELADRSVPVEWSRPPVTPRRRGAPIDRPLDGLRVVDFGSYVAGPFASQCLADFGADVIKVEPLSGEKGREINQFTGCQRGKRSLTLDLRHPRAHEVLRPLLASADVVMHNVRAGAARKMGIDEDAVRAANPTAVFGHSTGYGSAGPWSHLPAFDPTGVALSGWGHGISGPGQRPSWLRMSCMDAHTGLATFAGVALALVGRQRTGHAGRASSSLLAVGATSASETLLSGPDLQPSDYAPVTPDQTGVNAWQRIYQARDGWVAVSARRDDQRTAMVAALGGEADTFAATIAEQAGADVLRRLEHAGVPAEAVALDNRDRFFDAELAAGTGLVRRTTGTPYGWFENPGGFWSEPAGVLRNDRPIPGIGQHTTEVLTELGFSAEQIADLASDEVVGLATAQEVATA
jgi:crotonobetainyl-CoA:carnitine CoA-transferase CaiB-like acyl-CoA transferase